MTNHPDFDRLARGLVSGNIDLDEDYEDQKKHEFGKLPLVPAALTESNVVTSRLNGGIFDNTPKHRVAIDLDMDAALIPSSTRGHHHLIIKKDLAWDDYTFLLHALARVGIIQEGYLKASLARGATVLRTPWTKKEKKSDDNVQVVQ